MHYEENSRKSLILIMVGTGRFELPTPRTPSECSTRLSHVPTQSNRSASADGSQGPNQFTPPPPFATPRAQQTAPQTPRALRLLRATGQSPTRFAAHPLPVYTFAHMPIAIETRSVSSPLLRLPRLALVYFLAVVALAQAAHAQGANHLLIYAIDVEGGQSTLLVDTRTHASLLIDTGWPSVDGRDATRIQAAMRDAGITRVDHLLITHAAYLKAIAGKPHRVVHPGDTINIPGLTAIVLTADGDHISAVPGVTPTPNPSCAAEPHWDLDSTENPRSAGVLIGFGKFRFLDLGDLTKAKEIPLVCPNNLIGTVDLYLVNHHGFNLSNSRAFVDAIHPRVAIMNNGAHKAGSPEAWQTVHESPGLEDLWMLHTAEDSDAAHNSAPELIANPRGGPTDGAYLKVMASPDGSFSMTNSRTGKTKAYPHS
jgi:competence protein ComEC